MDGRMNTSPPKAQSDGDQDEDGHDDPKAGVEAETLVLWVAQDQEEEAHKRDYRTPRVPSPIVADTG
eukprot:121792-Amphidinium_carterae.2